MPTTNQDTPNRQPEPTPEDNQRCLQDLKNLKDGWANGVQHASRWHEEFGKAPSHEGLDWLSTQLTKYYGNGAPSPHIYPTPEGGISLEWSLGPNSASLEVDLTTGLGEWRCLNRDTGESEERELSLNLPESWSWLEGETRRLKTSHPA